MEEVHRELLRRAQAAADEARSQHDRSEELRAFVAALRKTGPAEIVRCAWCERVAAGGRWIEVRSLLGANLRERLRRNASHGICPDCMQRVEDEVERERSSRHP